MWQITLNCKKMISAKNIKSALNIIKEESQFRVPIDTGYLQDSAFVKRISKEEYWVGHDCEYGIYVHERLDLHHTYGEAKFLVNAWEEKKNEFMEALTKPMDEG